MGKHKPVEIDRWAAQSRKNAKKKPTLNQLSKVHNMSADLLIIAVYVAVLAILASRDVAVALAAVTVSCLFSSSAAFDVATSLQVHLFYMITYAIFACLSRSHAVILAMSLMVVLNIFMALDAHYYAQTKTWAFNHYIVNTSLVHLAIVLSLFHGRTNVISYHSVHARLRNLFAGAAYLSRSRFISSGNTIKTNKITEARP